jgi:predicted nucleic acid-binding protein
VILADTSVWVDHLRNGNARLAARLAEGGVASHPFIIGELACGNLRDRDEVVSLLERLPAVPVATHDEALKLIASRGLAGTGLGWIDVHLLASALLGGTPLWTLDQALKTQAARCGMGGMV